jgi:hypothetical protein
MRFRLSSAAITAFAIGGLVVGLQAQQTTQIHPGKGGSPHERYERTVNGANVTIEYGRPYMKKRKVFGQLVPHGQVWRTGADEATILKTDRPLVMGGKTIPEGSYSLYTIPGDDAWTLIVNKQTGQWGTQYDEKQDLARIDMKRETLDQPVEQFTIEVDERPGGGVLRMEWENTRASVPFTVQGT